MRSLIFAVLLVAPLVTGASVTQTNWYDGPGLQGPVNQWDSRFLEGSEIIWRVAGSVEMLPYTNHVIDDDFVWSESVDSADVDGDGVSDVVGGGSGGVAWWDNIDGSGTVWEEHTVQNIGEGVSGVSSGDIDGDGDQDIAAGFYWPNLVCWYENADGSGTSWVSHGIDLSFAGVRSVCVEDVNGDGHEDLLGGGDAGEAVWWENDDGVGDSWTKHVIGSGIGDVYQICSGDVDGDGFIDAISASLDGDIVWWENNDGSGLGWTRHTIDAYFASAQWASCADIDLDGDLDVLGTSASLDLVVWWANANGAGTSWVEHDLPFDINGATCASAADLDSDGDLDIMGGGRFEQQVSWFENLNGSGTSWVEHMLDAYYADASELMPADMNGDGMSDILAVFDNGTGFRWWERKIGSAQASLVSSILYLHCDPDWGSLSCSANTPFGASLGVLVRASDDFADMGSWSDTLASPCNLEGILTDNCSYLQYMVILETVDIEAPPELYSITFDYGSVAIGDGYASMAPSVSLEGVFPNPALEVASVHFSLLEPAPVTLRVFDVAGRLAAETRAGEAETASGANSISLEHLAPGVYFCVMSTEGFEATRRFVVVE